MLHRISKHLKDSPAFDNPTFQINFPAPTLQVLNYRLRLEYWRHITLSFFIFNWKSHCKVTYETSVMYISFCSSWFVCEIVSCILNLLVKTWTTNSNPKYLDFCTQHKVGLIHCSTRLHWKPNTSHTLRWQGGTCSALFKSKVALNFNSKFLTLCLQT